MAVFETLAENLDDIMTMLITNDDVKRLLVNNSRNALNEPVPAIPISDYFDKYIFDVQKLHSITDEVKTFICAEFVNARPSGGDNIDFYNVDLQVDILTHYDATWKLDGKKKRIYTLSDIVDIEIKKLEIDSIRGSFVPSGWSKVYYDSDGTFQGRRLSYSITNESVDCG